MRKVLRCSLIYLIFNTVAAASVPQTETDYFLAALKREAPRRVDLSESSVENSVDLQLLHFMETAGLTRIERWLPGAGPEDRDGEIYLQNIYKCYPAAGSSLESSLSVATLSSELIYAEAAPRHRAAYIPNDPGVGQGYQWYLGQVAAYAAWDLWNIAAGELPVGKSVTVGIIDSGVDYTHPDLTENIAVNQGELGAAVIAAADRNRDGMVTASELLSAYSTDHDGSGTLDLRDILHENSVLTDGIDGDGNGYIDDLLGYDLAGDGSSKGDRDAFPPVDETIDFGSRTHGTHVAGIAGARADNRTGIAGVGFDLLILPVKASADDDSDGYITHGFQGLLYAAKTGARVLNASWGSSSYSYSEQSVINTLYNSYGVLIVAASGNGTEDGEEYARFYPASYDRVLSVTALGKDDLWNQWATYHESVDIAAPGEEITSTVINSEAGGYGTGTGTSMAAPIVSGAAALLWSLWPEASNFHIETVLKNSSDDIYTVNSSETYRDRLGTGRLNIASALTLVTSIEHGSPEPVRPSSINLTLGPNPFNTSFELIMESSLQQSAELNIYDILGRRVFSESLYLQSGVSHKKMSMARQASGIYILILRGKHEVLSRKLLLNK